MGSPEESAKSTSLFPILFVNFIGTLGFSIVIPFLVFLVARFGGNAIIYGLMGAMYPAFQLIGAPILGRWSDIYGRKKILLLSQIGTLVSWIIFLVALFLPVNELLNVDSSFFGAFAITLPLVFLFIARGFDGLTGGNVSVANAYLADISSEEDRNKNYGKMSISSNLGFIIGPALAGFLSLTVYGEAIPVLAAVLISVAGTIAIIRFVPESRKCAIWEDHEADNISKPFGQEIKKCPETHGPVKIKFSDVLSLTHVPYMLVLYFFIFLGFNVFYTAFPLHAVEQLEWGVADMGIYFSFLGVLMIFVQGPVLVRAVKVYSDATLATIGSLLLGICFLLLLPGTLFMTYLSAVFFAAGNGLMWPSVLSILSKIAGDRYQGSVQGFASSFASLASIFGLVMGGVVYEFIGTNTFIITSVVIFFVFFLTLRLHSFEKQPLV
ncbi:MFS family permease [Methanohalophilus levihalophilus]|uniref:MFS transporter n=1 Tax=Methanohalophilus levihalophilus TaxID=1431282 RepID=UPI001AE39F27|nr:MFS transporter [Methanohalophilus levihalophilus]MBP2030879.1 MFS family permease [Methanohalophilus levihalophilus]